MKLLIKGGTLEAEIKEPGILSGIQDQLKQIQEDKDTGIEDLQDQINTLEFKQKQDRLKFGDKVTEESEARDKKIASLKEEILAFPVSETGKIRGEMTEADRRLELIMDRIKARIDKLTRSKNERTKRMRNDFSKDDVEIVAIKKDIDKVRQSKLPKPVKTRKEKGVKDGRPFMGKLEDKSKLPI